MAASPAAPLPNDRAARCVSRQLRAEGAEGALTPPTRIDDGDYRALPMLARVKVWAHGMTTAYTPNADACPACGLCVVACPEKAITLEKRTPR